MIIDATKPQESISAHQSSDSQRTDASSHNADPKKDAASEPKKGDTSSTKPDGMKATAKFEEKSSGSPMADKKI
jgi:hypothetical protein